MLPQHAALPGRLRGLGLAALAAAALPASAAAAELAGGVEASLVVPEALLPAVGSQRALAGLPVFVVPGPATLERAATRPARPARARAAPSGWPRLSVRAPLRPSLAPALRALLRAAPPGQPACALVVQAQSGFSPAALELLDRAGPCLVELHLSSPQPFAERLERRRETSVVVHPERPPGPRELAEYLRLPRPRVAVADDGSAPALLVERLAKLGTPDLGLEVRAPRGALSDKTFVALRAPRAWPLRVLAEGGLDPEAARDLRTLGALEVRVSLEDAAALPPRLAEAIELLRAPVAPPVQPGPDPARLPWPTVP